MQINNFKNISPVFVGGANGFTGRFVCLELIKREIPFIALVRKGNDVSWLKSKKSKPKHHQQMSFNFRNPAQWQTAKASLVALASAMIILCGSKRAS